MKHPFSFAACGLLVLVMAGSVAAAPDLDVPTSGTWEVDCRGSDHPDLGVFTVVSSSLPGWSDEGVGGSSGFHAASVSVWEAKTLIWGFQVPVPSGLMRQEGLVGPCQMHILGGSRAVFDIELHDVYYVRSGT
jgi:hypothetical protein